jgi:ATP-dependent DNA ligase
LYLFISKTIIIIKTELNITLFKKDSKGKIRVAEIKTLEGDLTISTGLKGGKKVQHLTSCEPKNVGRKNETSKKEQAIAEGLSKVKLKLREGYFMTEKEALNIEVIKPMLAEDFHVFKSKVKYPCYAQPKFDGIRALKEKKLFRSRKNKAIETVSHITEELSNLDLVLDGELYAHGLDFQTNTELIKKKRKETLRVKYYVYDVIMNKPYSDRLQELKRIFSMNDCKYIELVPTYTIESEKELQVLHDRLVKEGYEGIMIRHGQSPYEINKRSKSLLKFKEMMDRAYPVVDIVPANKNKKHGVPIVKITDKPCPLTTKKISFFEINGKQEEVVIDGVKCGYPTTRCNVKLSHKERESLLKNKKNYIGKLAEVRFFEFHSTGVPRFPVFHGLRLDK